MRTTLSLLVAILSATPSLAGQCWVNRGSMICDNGQTGIVAPAYPTYGQRRGLSIMTDNDDDRPTQQTPRRNCFHITDDSEKVIDLTGCN